MIWELFSSLVVGALIGIAAVVTVVAICAAVFYIFYGLWLLAVTVYDILEEKHYQKKRLRETAGRKQYEKQGGPW